MRFVKFVIPLLVTILTSPPLMIRAAKAKDLPAHIYPLRENKGAVVNIYGEAVITNPLSESERPATEGDRLRLGDILQLEQKTEVTIQCSETDEDHIIISGESIHSISHLCPRLLPPDGRRPSGGSM